MARSESAEGERNGLNAQGNPQREFRSSDGGLQSEGPVGQVRPTGVLARGVADKKLWGSRGGMEAGTERLRSRGR
jgi:hypothetical protein